MAMIMPNGNRTATRPMGGGRTNRFDGSGWASDGTRIPAGGQAQPQQSPYAAATTYGQKPQSSPYQGGTNQQQTRTPSLTDYMAPGSPMPGRTPRQPTGYQGYQPTSPSSQPRITPSISFAPGTSEEYKNQAYNNWNNNGWASVPRPADYGNDFRRPSGGVGNWGNQMQGRPDPFYMDGADPFGGWGGMDQFLGQRAAFVNNINQHRGMTAAQGLPPAPMDFNQMWNQAGQMYQQGWQNPLQGLFG